MKGLFPELPKDLTALSDAELADIITRSEKAVELIEAEDAEFLEGLSADEVIAQFKAGAEGIMALREERGARDKAAEDYAASKAEIAQSLKAEAEGEDGAATEGEDGAGDGEAEGEGTGDGEAAGDEATAGGEGEGGEAEGEAEVSDPVKEKVLVADASGDGAGEAEAATEPEKPQARLRRVPTPARERVAVSEESPLSFVASGFQPGTPPGAKLKDKRELASAVASVAKSVGRPAKRADGMEERFLVASLDYGDRFPDDRRLDGDIDSNSEKIAAVGNPYLGNDGMAALLASGGFCAPLQPIYSMPQLASQARPVRDALPGFRAERGGINVPTPTTMGDAAGAITVITADEDGQGGTFATKACLDMTCPDYTETAVTVISHCREFGNLNAMAWPEKISHENELTMAEHARVAEGYLLGRLKTLSVQVTTGVDTLGALIYLVDAIEKAEYGIRSRLRLPNEARFTLLAPRVLLDILELDTISTQFDRFRSSGALEQYLSDIGVDVSWYMDTPLRVGDASAPTGTSQIADATQAAGAIDGLPANVQMAFFPAGTFLHLDMAELNLGIVRDSTLNSTNDFQIFGEVFENVARIGPAQAAYWITANICPTGQFPPAGTARTCE